MNCRLAWLRLLLDLFASRVRRKQSRALASVTTELAPESVCVGLSVVLGALRLRKLAVP